VRATAARDAPSCTHVCVCNRPRLQPGAPLRLRWLRVGELWYEEVCFENLRKC
jgi:hypothetical protein